jgi:hypothetical protein
MIKSWIGQEELLDKAAYSHQLGGANGLTTWLSPTQMKVIPVYQSKTAVAQMHFASQPPCPREAMAAMVRRCLARQFPEDLLMETLSP